MPQRKSAFRVESKDKFLSRKNRIAIGEILNEAPIFSIPREYSLGKNTKVCIIYVYIYNVKFIF